MIEDRSKRRAAGRVKWAINKLLAHADMAVKVPEAAISQVLPSAQQCLRLAEGLGAALVELERAPDAPKPAFDSSAWVGDEEALHADARDSFDERWAALRAKGITVEYLAPSDWYLDGYVAGRRAHEGKSPTDASERLRGGNPPDAR